MPGCVFLAAALCRICHNISLQARQLRKSLFVPDNGKYDPEVHTSSTVLAGSAILQAGVHI